MNKPNEGWNENVVIFNDNAINHKMLSTNNNNNNNNTISSSKKFIDDIVYCAKCYASAASWFMNIEIDISTQKRENEETSNDLQWNVSVLFVAERNVWSPMDKKNVTMKTYFKLEKSLNCLLLLCPMAQLSF